MKLKESIEQLAKKAAKDWLKLSSREQQEYEEQGTSMLFETYYDEYNKVLNPYTYFDDDEVEKFIKENISYEVDLDDEDAVTDAMFDYLDEMLWELVEEYETKINTLVDSL